MLVLQVAEKVVQTASNLTRPTILHQCLGFGNVGTLEVRQLELPSDGEYSKRAEHGHGSLLVFNQRAFVDLHGIQADDILSITTPTQRGRTGSW